MKLSDVLKYGDERAHPFLLPDGSLVMTKGGHRDFIEDIPGDEMDIRKRHGLVSLSYSEHSGPKDGPRALSISVVRGQELTAAQISTLRKLANRRNRGQKNPNLLFIDIHSDEIETFKGNADDLAGRLRDFA